MFGLTDKAESLVGGNVNKHFNTFTMAASLHYFFDHLKFWLEEVIGEASKNFSGAFLVFHIPVSAEHLRCLRSEAIILHTNRRASSSPRDIQGRPGCRG
jgi:hypothetical protein